jgi:hypothetical protein
METRQTMEDQYEGFFSRQFICSRIKKGEGQGKEKCHAKSMMSKEANERLKRDTQHVPPRLHAVFFFNFCQKCLHKMLVFLRCKIALVAYIYVLMHEDNFVC